MKLTKADVENLAGRLAEMGFADDVSWSEGAKAPEHADDFASEAIFVICNSGMKNTVARGIFNRVMDELDRGGPAFEAFKHPGKSAAIDHIWVGRLRLYREYMALGTDADRLDYLGALPWIGNITKYHLAKNFGVDVAKPDIHLQRLADHHDETVQGLCERLARDLGWKARTIDLVLWRACAEGLINSRDLAAPAQPEPPSGSRVAGGPEG